MVDDTNSNLRDVGSSGAQPTAGQQMKQGWNEFKGKVRQKWNQLTDKDLDTNQNRNRNDFVGYVHGKVGGDRGLVERDIDNYARETNYRF